MNVMCAIIKITDDVGPIVEHTKPYTKFLVNNLTLDNVSEDSNEETLIAHESFGDSFSVDETGIDINNGIDTLGYAVSASGHLSPQSLSMENMIKSSTPQQQFNVMKGGNLYNFTMQVMESIKTDAQRKTFTSLFSEFHANNLKEKILHTVIQQKERVVQLCYLLMSLGNQTLLKDIENHMKRTKRYNVIILCLCYLFFFHFM